MNNYEEIIGQRRIECQQIAKALLCQLAEAITSRDLSAYSAAKQTAERFVAQAVKLADTHRTLNEAVAPRSTEESQALGAVTVFPAIDFPAPKEA